MTTLKRIRVKKHRRDKPKGPGKTTVRAHTRLIRGIRSRFMGSSVRPKAIEADNLFGLTAADPDFLEYTDYYGNRIKVERLSAYYKAPWFVRYQRTQDFESNVWGTISKHKTKSEANSAAKAYARKMTGHEPYDARVERGRRAWRGT